MNSKLLLERINVEEHLYTLVETEEIQDLLRLTELLEEEADARQREVEALQEGYGVYSQLVAQGIETKEQLAEAYYAAAMDEAKKDRKSPVIMELLEEGMRLGSKKARFEYARALLYGTYGNNTSKQEALGYIQEEAEKDDPEAIYMIACIHNDFPDLVDGPYAYQMCQKAASMGYSPAIVRLRNPFDARPYIEVLKEKADQGDAHACYLLSCRDELDAEMAADYFQKAMDLGDAEALYLYGEALLNEGDFAQAKEFLVKAMDAGSAEACILLGEQLASHQGKPSFYADDAKESGESELHQSQFECFEKAASLGDLPSLGRVAYAYLIGYPIPKNLALAGKYAKRGMELGDRFLCPFVLAAVLEEDEDAKGEESVEHYRIAAENGNAAACLALSRIYHDGLKEIEPNEKLSKRYLFLSGTGRD